MDHIAAAEERLVNERLRQKLNEVNAAAQSHLAGIQDHINFTLQQAYFKCAYECFDRKKKQNEIGNCVEQCSVPVLNAQNLVESEMAKFQERLSRSLTVCQDKYEAAKLQQNSNNPTMKDLESCVELSVQDSINMMPHLAGKLKAYMSIKD
ncbi:protein fam136a [Phtheirospermum japonicum]|uniref:Protein fam136a n=2 Tax=Phtheirospermum japonicum TaxID=374723 RepID=A0A830C2G1_9LAMI|nr:protein fam136a [Phtheirospermum japonicum]